MSKVRVLVGTRKGAFILTSDGKREKWDVSGPHFAGWEIYHLKGSPVDPNRIYASQTSGWFGQIIQRSDDGGKTWHQPGTPAGDPTPPRAGMPKGESNKFVYDASAETASRSPRISGMTARSIRGNSSASGTSSRRSPIPTPSTPASKTRRSSASTDGGTNWHELSGLRGHGTGPEWQPGAGGMCLHTIILDPERSQAHLHRDLRRRRLPHRRRRQHLEAHQPRSQIAIHSRSHRRSRPLRPPHRHAPDAPDVLFMQKHWDVMRSDNAGDQWTRSQRQPAHRLRLRHRRPRPRTRDDLRRPHQERLRTLPPDGKLRVYRSRTGGNEWEPLTKGLPQKDCYVNVLRDAMAVDSLDQCGVYFGTTGGQVYASRRRRRSVGSRSCAICRRCFRSRCKR